MVTVNRLSSQIYRINHMEKNGSNACNSTEQSSFVENTKELAGNEVIEMSQ